MWPQRLSAREARRQETSPQIAKRWSERQLKRRGISDATILDAFRAVPREAFVSPELPPRSAYEDHPLPIEAGQTICQPYIVALMLAAAEIVPRATACSRSAPGSGYAAAIISRIAREGHRHRAAARARRTCSGTSATGSATAMSRIVEGDGTRAGRRSAIRRDSRCGKRSHFRPAWSSNWSRADVWLCRWVIREESRG